MIDNYRYVSYFEKGQIRGYRMIEIVDEIVAFGGPGRYDLENMHSAAVDEYGPDVRIGYTFNDKNGDKIIVYRVKEEVNK